MATNSNANLSVFRIFDAQALAISTTVTSNEIPIARAGTFALHIVTLSGTTPDITFKYSVCNNTGGTFIQPTNNTIKASASGTDVISFIPPPAKFIKILAINNSGANTATLTAQLAFQDVV